MKQLDMELLTITSSTALCVTHETNQQDAASKDMTLDQGCSTRLCIVHTIDLQQLCQRCSTHLLQPSATVLSAEMPAVLLLNRQHKARYHASPSSAARLLGLQRIEV